MAILETLLVAVEKEWHNLTVFSNSKSALLAIASRFDLSRSSYLVLRVKDLFLSMYKAGKRMKLVPSHVSISGNERADALTKDAVMRGRDSHLGVPLGRGQKLLKRYYVW